MKYQELGFIGFEEYVKYFFDTLLSTNKTYEYFVDWTKVTTTIKKYVDELALFNSLTKLLREERIPHLHHLFSKYPRVVEILPMLIAERAKNNIINIFDPVLDAFINFDFHGRNVNNNTIPQLIEFCDKTGIVALFGEIKDVSDYLLGVEVGLDSNARKNRSGDIFSDMIKKQINKTIGSKYKVVFEDPKFSLYERVSSGRFRGKKHDVVVYCAQRPELVIECNFYNTTGSKPISIAESYPKMFRAAKDYQVEFLWVTDGPAWHKMQEPLLRAMKEMDWVFNFRMLKNIEVILKD